MQTTVRVVQPDSFQAPHVFRSEKTPTKAELQRLFRKQSARDFIGTLKPAFHIFGLSKGQFSLIDLIRETLVQAGPVHLALSTWTVAHADLEELQRMVTDKAFLSLRFLLDFSFQRRQPGLIAQIRKCYGNDSVVVTRNHAKFLLFGNAAWKIVVRTSMNLNFNPRLEDVEMKDDPELYSFLNSILDDLFKTHEAKHQAGKTCAQLGPAFANFS